METIRILIADDHEAVRRGVRSLLSSRGEWVLCGEASDGIEAIEKSKELAPNIVLMDISMPRMNGLEATQRIRETFPGIQVLIVTQHDAPEMAKHAVQVGAAGYVLKSHLSADLLPAIDAVLNHKRSFTPVLNSASTPSSGKSTSGSALVQDYPAHDDLDLLAGGGEMGELMRSHDWSSSPFGAISKWPQSLRTAVRICLDSRFPIVLWWGPELRLLYNDAWRPVLGTTKHPAALGSAGKDVWPEIWHIIGPMLEGVVATGKATWEDDQLLLLERHGYLEEAYFTYSYSAIRLPSGEVGGVFAAVHETTQRVLGDRRLRTLREVADQTTTAKSVEQACSLAIEILSRNSLDIPYAFIYSPSGSDGFELLASSLPTNETLLPRKLMAASQLPWAIKEACNSLQAQIVQTRDVADQLPTSPHGKSCGAAVTFPVFVNRDQGVLATLTVGVNPHRELDVEYTKFLEGIAANLGSNISNARAYEQEKQRAEGLAEIDRAKTLFFSNVSHEFRTPLTLMMGPLEDAMRSPEPMSAEHREQLAVAHRNSQRLLKLVNTLLDFSRIEAGRAQPQFRETDLAEYTSDLASVFRSTIEKAGLKYSVNCARLRHTVFVDRDMWEKIVFNLLSNAFKFTPSGEIEISLKGEADSAVLTVRDTGSGIPSWELPNIFKRFHRVEGTRGRTHEGTGIGLALAQELVKLHDGNTEVQSKLGVGTEFRVRIPFTQKRLPPGSVTTALRQPSTALHGETFVEEATTWLPKEAQGLPVNQIEQSAHLAKFEGRPSIILAEDNADMREYIQRLLQTRYMVEPVGDGMAALKAARKLRPDLILSDVMMPQMDGLQLIRELRADEKLKTIPIILLSARAGEEARVEGFSRGADDYVTKPFSGRELLARIDTHLQLAQVRRDAEERIRNSEEKLRLFVEYAPAAVAMFDREMRYVAASRRWLEDYRIDNDVIGRSHYAMFPEIPERWKQIHRRCLAGAVENADEDRFSRTDGSLNWIKWEARPWRNVTGDIGGILILTEDITERKRTEEVLRQNRERFDLVTAASDVGIWFCDLPFGELVWDDRVKEHFWLPPGATVTIDTFYERLHPDDRERTRLAIETAIATRSLYDIKYRTVSPDGREKWIRAVGRAFFDEAGNPKRFDGVTLDTTQRKRT